MPCMQLFTARTQTAVSCISVTGTMNTQTVVTYDVLGFKVFRLWTTVAIIEDGLVVDSFLWLVLSYRHYLSFALTLVVSQISRRLWSITTFTLCGRANLIRNAVNRKT